MTSYSTQEVVIRFIDKFSRAECDGDNLALAPETAADPATAEPAKRSSSADHTEVLMLQASQGALSKDHPGRLAIHAGMPIRRIPGGGLRFGRCEVRPASREVRVDGQARQIQPRPFDLLVYLIEHRDRVLSMDELLDVIWGQQVVQPSSLTVAINRIRNVLGDDRGEIIRTHHRVGYRFAAELEGDDDAIEPRQHPAAA
jgi:DNA-binding winged helix-turn-helix (wHTH) protein